MTSIQERIGALYDVLAGQLAALVAVRADVPADVVGDAVHDVFVELLKDAAIAERVLSLPSREQAAYLFVAARNRAWRLLRKTRRDQPLAPDVLLRVLADRRFHDIGETELRDLVDVSIRELREPYRTVLRLLLLDNKDASEIAAAVGRSVNTVYQQIHRGLGLLRAAVRERLTK